MITLDEVIEKSGLHPTRIINVYLFGSVIYGTSSDESDYDILIIAKTPYDERELVVDNFNMHILSMDRFLEGLKKHNIRNIECLFSTCLKEEIKITLDINIRGLRHSISHITANSYVKSKKKINQGDYHIGIKSLFHSLRIVMFGKQLVKNGSIYNFSEANYIWEDLISKIWTWDELDIKYKSLKNKLLSEFRLITLK